MPKQLSLYLIKSEVGGVSSIGKLCRSVARVCAWARIVRLPGASWTKLYVCGLFSFPFGLRAFPFSLLRGYCVLASPVFLVSSSDI